MKGLWELGHFLRTVRARMKHGELSRGPLRLLRVEWVGKTGECDWMARPPDIWDADLPSDIRERHASLQALKDAMAMRDLFFFALPDVRKAVFRTYRESPREPPELIIVGALTRDAPAPERVASVAMRAKLYGFRFVLDDGVLEPLQTEELAVSSY